MPYPMLCITLMEFKNLVGGREGKGREGKFISVMQSIRVGHIAILARLLSSQAKFNTL